MDVQSSSTHNRQKVETAWMFNNWRIDKQNVSKYGAGDFSFIILSSPPTENRFSFEVTVGEKGGEKKRDK